MIYNVLRPIYTMVGAFYQVDWMVIGTAWDMQDAKNKYGGAPVLEVK